LIWDNEVRLNIPVCTIKIRERSAAEDLIIPNPGTRLRKVVSFTSRTAHQGQLIKDSSSRTAHQGQLIRDSS
jgi:hypothetical protein